MHTHGFMDHECIMRNTFEMSSGMNLKGRSTGCVDTEDMLGKLTEIAAWAGTEAGQELCKECGLCDEVGADFFKRCFPRTK